MNETTITNITQKDFQKKQIRILVHQKELFSLEQLGQSKTYDVTVYWKDMPYTSTYRSRTKDGKNRSGILRLKDGLAEVLGKK
jgi:hypothetical protein